MPTVSTTLRDESFAGGSRPRSWPRTVQPASATTVKVIGAFADSSAGTGTEMTVNERGAATTVRDVVPCAFAGTAIGAKSATPRAIATPQDRALGAFTAGSIQT